VSGRSLGRLWEQYLAHRAKLASPEGKGPDRPDLERRTKRLRDRLVTNYSPLVKYTVGRVRARMMGSAPVAEFYSWGMLGLLDAVESYDPGRKTKFETYAISKIRWAILDEYRKQDPMLRSARARAKEVEQAEAVLTQRLGRAPTEAEVASEVGMSAGRYHAFLAQRARARIESLEDYIETGGALGSEARAALAEAPEGDPQSAAELEDLKDRLAGAIAALKERERLVITLYFHEELTLREIGKALGLTEGRISQILSRALGKLKEHLG
jgi:RNA polymerase sigma factor FliA